MDLFKLAVKEKRLHPLFRKVVSEDSYKLTTEVINQWSKGLCGRKKESKKFVQDFQISFNSSLWELYLNRAFIELGFDIDYSKESPDFNLIHKSGRVVNVEAVTANNKDHESEEYYSSESFLEARDLNNSDFLDQSTIKLAGKIKDKRDLFIGINDKKYPYQVLEHVKGNPFVIAVAPFDNHLSYSQNNMAINRVLYGINPPASDGNGGMWVENIDHILNHNNQPIELGIFTNDSYKEISAVIFSTTGTFGKAVVQAGIPNVVRATRYRQMGVVEFMAKEGIEMLGRSHKKIREGYDIFSMRFFDGNLVCGSDMYLYESNDHKESHLDGLHIYYNPYASIPLEADLFSAYEITQNHYDIKSKVMICNHNDGSLVSRQTYTSFS
ncbi:hypothetical protein [Vibrio lentus]|uniref:hypothetical protein n=1 Tax=Vibrio lentus TaxID=136468 RepID=UPI000C828C3E|nr:hypothetical protein [Vibrio lentus]PMJ56799.1 hypothetical protein BCU20_18665 [Vibrio lentus]